jgi:diguanylate cyclase (GGDEF)-like protein/PAS domain S-box-containing protein
VAIEKQKKTERKLKEIVHLHQVVTQNSRDLIILADFKGRRSYVSDAVEAMGGWTPDELRNQGSLDLVHPQDKPLALAAIRDIVNGRDDARLELRIRKVDGDFLWVESSLRAIRDPETGAQTGMLNVVRDISERKRAEKQLQDAYQAVAALAETDALTRLANRRKFDQYLTTEWRRCMREHTPISLLMIDADYFKTYNDTYGHTRGDSVLKQIAEAARDVVTRPGDLVARFGGEEFSVVLPNTDNEGAKKIADELCAAVRNRQLPHSSNPIGFLTLSIGYATLVPTFGHHAVNLIEAADQALYVAKHNGRNQVCNGTALGNAAEVVIR